MKKDIQNRADIIKLVDAFYNKTKEDPIIGHVFTNVAKVNWDLHLPRMYDFWENILFCTGNFDGNPMKTHKELNQKVPMNFTHFNRWNTIFNETVDALFKGEKAEEIKNRAMNISKAMMDKALA
uniref:group III truncated hemoglobin n=1 Tax=Flavobacterium sp. TaxID=239 RepID=UPI0040492C74